MSHSTTVPRRLGSSTLLLAFALFGFFPAPAAAQAPADLRWAPADAAGFIRILPLEIWNSEAMKGHRQLLNPAPEALQAIERKIGFNLMTVERITVIFPTRELFNPLTRESPVVAFGLSKPFDRSKLVKALAPAQAQEKKHLDVTYYVPANGRNGLALDGDRIFLIGSEKMLEHLLKRSAQKPTPGPLSEALHAARGKSHIVAGFNAAELPLEELRQELPPPFAALLPLLEARSLTATVHFGPKLEVDVRLGFANDAAAQAGEKALRAGLDLARQALEEPMQMLKGKLADESSDVGEILGAGIGLNLLRQVQELTKTLPIERKAAVVRVPLSLDVNYTHVALVGIAGIGVIGTRATATFGTVESTIPAKPRKP